MLFTYILLIVVVISKSVRGYDVNADLVRGLVNNHSITGCRSNCNGLFSDYPEDCARIFLNAKALNKNVSSGVYEIWPREGIVFFFPCMFYVFVY